ncbi:MAG: hypothetical protein HETSPECPRED_004256 [Heterodermia speciosa]|uniref:Asl1-like glycosyl hydrolase catalytic domain-containing protein n=1 Tax=Heterodermia speciosa TaxID=116794 RepID=A0A8H3J729_9LECA|nr:MAG: hypothetical protein HETSPECPRED_004256 [Heterodermia speciosa]
MVTKKRCLLWDWTNTQGVPHEIDKINFDGPMNSVSNWNTWIPPELKGRAAFRPMIHDLAKLSGSEWTNIENTKDGLIHYFNEPERAGITAEQAADIWFKQVVQLRNQGNKLVSPSCASDPQGEAWFTEFMDRVEKDPPDFIGVHYYGTDKNAAIKYFENMHNKHSKHPLYISELASISRKHEDVVEFTVDVANWCDQTPWIHEYAFFGCMRNVADNFVSPEAQLMNPDGSLKPLMHKIMNEQPMRK